MLSERYGDGVLDPPDDDAAQRERQHRVLVDLDLLDAPSDAELDAVTRLAATVCGTRFAGIHLLDTDVMTQPATFGFTGGASPRDESPCHRVAQFGGVFVSPDLAADPRFVDSAWVDGRWARVRLYAGAPLVVDGVVIGTLCVSDEVPGVLTEDQVARLDDLAWVVVALLERRRAARIGEAARAELVRANDELVRTQAFDRALLEALPVGVVAADAEGRITLFNQVSRFWHGHDTDSGLTPAELPTAYDLFEADGRTPLPADQVPLLRAYTEGRVTDAEIVIHPHDRFPRTVSCSATEVRDVSGRFLGAVVAMADVTAQRELEEQLRTAALHDPLTGLPNRSLLVDRLDHALVAAARRGDQVALLYCDLDGFKAVNDAHGHAAGDEVLAQAAVRLAAVVRPGDTAARIGGDEFVLMCPEVADPAVAAALAERVTEAMADPLWSSAGRHQVGVSVGVALSGPASTPETMLTAADEAMYVVKRGRPRRD